MRLKTLILILKTSMPVKEDGSKLRGYIGNRFREYPILHHHIREGGYLYTYPEGPVQDHRGNADDSGDRGGSRGSEDDFR